MNLFKRHPKNPVLTAADWPYPVHSVFNPGVTKLADGTTLLLCRCEDFRGISHLCAARSANGYDGWVVDKKPTMFPNPRKFPEELWGVEDPRITFVPDLEQYVITYTAFGEGGPGVALALTKDFKAIRRRGLVMSPDDKDAALLPRRFKDGYALVHRPVSGANADMWLSFSPDLKNWGRPQLVLKARRGAWWDARKIGLSPPPVETPEGWLVFYHGVRQHASGSLYRLGAALLDLEDPTKILRRGEEWIFGPEAEYEKNGDVPYVVFPTGWTIDDDGDTLNMYYGCADTCIGLATVSIRSIIDWLMREGTLENYLEEATILGSDIPQQPHSAHEEPTSEKLSDEAVK